MQLTIEISEETLDNLIEDRENMPKWSRVRSTIVSDIVRAITCTPEYNTRASKFYDRQTYDLTRREDSRQP